MQLGKRGIDRDVQVPGLRLDELGRIFLVQCRAIGRHACVDPVLMAERHQVDEARLDERLTAAEADRERADKVLDAQQGLLPLLNGHLILVVRQPPVLAVTAFDITPLVHHPVKRHGFREVFSRMNV